MDSRYNISIINGCECKIRTTLRDIIDKGLKPVLENITTVIAASLTNNSLFKQYPVEYLFTIGNTFNIKQDSLIFKAYNNILERKLKCSIESKEKDIQIFVIKESLCQLLKPVIHKKPYMLDNHVIGSLCQISKETYAIYHNHGASSIRVLDPNTGLEDSKYGNLEDVEGEEAARIFIRKGQLIPNTGIIKKFRLNLDKYITSGNLLLEMSNIRHSLILTIHI